MGFQNFIPHIFQRLYEIKRFLAYNKEVDTWTIGVADRSRAMAALGGCRRARSLQWDIAKELSEAVSRRLRWPGQWLSNSEGMRSNN